MYRNMKDNAFDILLEIHVRNVVSNVWNENTGGQAIQATASDDRQHRDDTIS